MEDKRIRRTKKAIKQFFLELLEKKDLNKITVAEITRLADIGRGTFYLHYKDVFDLYDKVESELYNDLLAIFNSSLPLNTIDERTKFIKNTTSFIAQNRKLFLLLIHSEPNGMALNKLKKIFSERLQLETTSKNELEIQHNKIEAIFITAGILGVIEDWLNHDINTPADDLANMLTHILEYFPD